MASLFTPFHKNMLRAACLLGIFGLCMARLQAQSPREFAISYIQSRYESAGLTASDLQDLRVTDDYVSRLSGNRHIYLRQAYQGIGIYGANLNICLGKNEEIITLNNAAVRNIEAKINTTTPVLTAEDAIRAAALHYKLPAPTAFVLMQQSSGQDRFTVFRAEEISEEEIPVRLMYMSGSDGLLHLSWDLSLLLPDGSHWWSLRVDALNGNILDEYDWTLSCDFGHPHEELNEMPPAETLDLSPASIVEVQAANTYNVFAEPVESPNHGGRSLKTAPWNLTASPFGWHDTNGAAGAEFTITRGNNVLAQEDADGNNGTGFSPDGGPTLDFDLPLNLSQAPAGYQSVALINLFYWNNLIHDYTYLYGFDEVSGNFQQNNYGNGGVGADYVLADGQDGSGTNNANFSTPADGNRPRMQMFLWTGATNVFFTVNSPGAVAGSYTTVEAGFGPGLSTTPITADLVLANDGPGSLGCTAPVNAAAISGKIALVDRGTCAFVNKVQNMQNAGAIACVVCNNAAGAAPFAMSGATGGINIPSVMISLENCNLLKAQLAAGVNVSLSNSGPVFAKDGDFDNGIIAHEYGHGISNRLTGGPANVNCLTNAEQMGEGWSDYFGLMMTMKASDLSTTSRGIGTYAISQPVTGGGIRPAPYTTNMAVNDFTYGDITNTTAISLPHGIGFLWCNMLWEMTWNLIGDFGFDADLMNGTGGNNIAMQLVMEGMRLQPCNPGFINGRDAILDADTALFGGVHSCQIWSAFAKRGLGLSASQGSANNRSDGAEAFDVPPAACSLLPVEWLAVSATAQEDAIRVAWEVAGEIQNQGFYVERKEERGPFQTLGFVAGKGHSAQSSTYSFEDQQVTPGVTYTYRLRQMDLDGGISFSPVAEARIAPRLGLEMALYPNPVSDVLYIELRDQPGSPVEVQVFDVVGRHVQTEQFPAEERQLHVDMSGLGAGVYLLRLSVAGRQAYERVVVE